MHKYVDDTTITEIIRDRKTPSVMDDSVQYLVSWPRTNKMLINHTKTKEMILDNAKADQIPPLYIEGRKIERVTEFKLLGVHISDGRATLMSSTIKYRLDCTFSKSSNDLVSAQMIYSISILLSFDLYLNMHVLSGIIT